MSLKHIYCCLGVLSLACASAFAQAEAPDVQGAHGKAPLAGKGPSPEPKLLTRCNTSMANCAGLAYWRNNSGQFVSCTIFWSNGAAGVTNFVLRPNGDTATYHVRTGDTNACVWGNSGVPAGTQRYYILVD